MNKDIEICFGVHLARLLTKVLDYTRTSGEPIEEVGERIGFTASAILSSSSTSGHRLSSSGCTCGWEAPENTDSQTLGIEFDNHCRDAENPDEVLDASDLMECFKRKLLEG